MGKFSRLGNDLYEGRTSVDFVGRKWLWYSLSGVILVLAVFGLTTRGLNLGVEFKGGVEYTVTSSAAQPFKTDQASADKLAQAVGASGIKAAASPTVLTSGKNSLTVQTEQMSSDDTQAVSKTIAKSLGITGNINNAISAQEVGASWGSQVASRALTGLIVFLIAVVIFIWAYFRQWKMSIAAIVALGHDLLITVGVYALSGFQVTPATVTGVLTILGFSLYDTVVVFDKIRENTKNLRQSRRTYSELANLALNQTLVRSINTSFVALLPVAAILYVSATQLGSGSLKDLALALFVGMLAGTYSSIFIATPLLVQLKSSEKEISDQAARAKARQRRDADRYASVPSFSEDLPLVEEPGGSGMPAELVELDEQEVRPRVVVPPRRPEASGSGRVVPAPKAPVEQSGSAKRNQPRHQPRSKRGK